MEIFLLLLDGEDVFDGAGRDEEFFRTYNCEKTEHESQVEDILRAEGPDLGRVRQGHLVLGKVKLQVLPRHWIVPFLKDELDLLKVLLELLD